jgi:hypothetical protein
MTARVKLAAFAVAIAAAFGLGLGAGALAGPFDDGDDQPPALHQHWSEGR